MELTRDQQEIRDGRDGETLAKVMRSLIMYGETFGATHMVKVTGAMGHLVTSFGLSVMKPVQGLMQELIDNGALSSQPFTVDPRPIDKNVPSNLIQDIVFKVMYSRQAYYEKQLSELGLLSGDAFTCTCYMDEIGNTPSKGDILSWAESSAVVYANSVLGARCNRNSGIIELFGSIVGYVPYFGLLTDEGRKASWIIELRTRTLPPAQLLGSAIGLRVTEEVPYIKGLQSFLGNELNDDTKAYCKDMGAAAASNGAVGLYHIEGLTPEAVELGDSLLLPNANTYVIDDDEIARVRKSYPCIWKNPAATPKLCFVGCPHLSSKQLHDWTNNLEAALAKSGQKTVRIPTVFTAAPAVKDEFEKTPDFAKLTSMKVILSDICPLMYMNNPKCRTMPVITNSNKLRTYTTARYHNDDEILALLADGGIRNENI